MASRERRARRVRFGVAELIPDRESGWIVAVDGVWQSHVDLADPARLRMPFARWIGAAIDRHWPKSVALSAIMVGGAGCTLPRYVAATRPGSALTVFELDGPLVELVREHLALDEVPGLDVRVCDGRDGIRASAAGVADLVVLDVFQAGDVVTGVATVEFLADTAKVLRPGGLLACNVWSSADLAFALRVIASAGAVFPHVLALGLPGTFLRRQAGNIVVIASSRELPVAELVAWGAVPGDRVTCLTSRQLAVVSGVGEPLTESASAGPVEPVPGDGSSEQRQ